MRACHQAGHFDPDRVRGRGVWWEDELGPVVNDGARLSAGGLTRPLGLAGRGIYVSAKRWPGLLDADPLAAEACGALPELLDALPWRHPAHARLLAGWLALAGVCGALP